jgi:hypothetical protein
MLSRDPWTNPNVIYEEEILRGGSVMRRTVKQARWHDGSVATWVGRQQPNGRGEGSSGLAFDQVTLKKRAPYPRLMNKRRRPLVPSLRGGCTRAFR